MAKSRIQKMSARQERKIAEDVGGRRQAGSGSSWRAKSDVRTMGKLRVEAKFTQKPTYTLKLDDWKKIREEAIKGGLETPVMQVEFTPPGSSPGMKFAVMDYKLFLDWHKFSQDKGIQLVETWTGSKSIEVSALELLQLKMQALKDDTTPTTKFTFSVLTEPREQKWELVVIPWDVFTEIYEAYQP
jgi:hypothetical protein